MEKLTDKLKNVIRNVTLSLSLNNKYTLGEAAEINKHRDSINDVINDIILEYNQVVVESDKQLESMELLAVQVLDLQRELDDLGINRTLIKINESLSFIGNRIR